MLAEWSGTVAEPAGTLAFASGLHGLPAGALALAGLAFEPFTGLVCGSAVFGGTHTFGGFAAASAAGKPRPEMSTANTATIATRGRFARTRENKPF
ncbi:hypothetical protein ACFXDJ_08645 [Streptomyces sp. NPDC059443]|uniref:hypothetical protein n=1 Tax=unclassified Streptomyces TaxID=2593676 RepID=UPI00369C56F3